MFLKKVISVIGILIPILFLISFGLLFNTHSVSYEAIDEVSLFCFNIEELDNIWIRVFNYFLIGFLIIIFSLGLIKINSKSFSNNLGLVFLAFTGIIWCSFSFFTISIEDVDMDNSFFLILLFLLFTCISFLMLSGDILLIINNKVLKKVLLIFAVLIFTESILEFVVDDYPIMAPNLSALFYISVFPILGYNLSKDL